MHSPMEQFEIKRLLNFHIGSLDASFTNSALWMVVAVALATVVFVFGMSRRAMVPGRLQATAELGYEFIAGMVRDNVGNAGRKYFPFIFTLFVFVLMANLLGMFPYFPTVTSQLIVTVALALVVFFMVIIAGLIRHGFHFFKLFVPSGIPVVLLPLVVAIEIISFFTRPVSHSVRLFANMLAGHITVKVFAGFIFSLGSLGALGIAGAILPLVMVVGLTALEILIAFLQAYVFAMLACIYINDAIHPGH